MLEHGSLLHSEAMKGLVIFVHQRLHTEMMIHSDYNSTINLIRNICHYHHHHRIDINNNNRCLMQIMVKVGAISALATFEAEDTMRGIFTTVISGNFTVKIGDKHTF